jgi:hypothetical protein
VFYKLIILNYILSMPESSRFVRIIKAFSIRHFAFILLGLSISVVTIEMGIMGWKSFFKLYHSNVVKGPHFWSISTMFVLGIVLFIYGIIRQVQDILFMLNSKKK